MRPLPLIISKYASGTSVFLEEQQSSLSQKFDIHIADNPASLQSAILASIKPSDMIIVGGGDGTLSCAARILTNTEKALAILPLGTTNNFAKSIGYSEQSLKSILDFYTKTFTEEDTCFVDVGVVNKNYFLNVCSIGISGRIAEEVDRRQKRIFGRLAYLFQALKFLTRARKFRVELASGESPRTYSVYQILVFNGTHHAGIQIKNSSYLENGKLYLVLLGGATVFHYLYYFIRFMTGYPSKLTPRFSLKGFSLTLHREESLELDGESKKFLSGVFAVEHTSLKIIKLPDNLP